MGIGPYGHCYWEVEHKVDEQFHPALNLDLKRKNYKKRLEWGMVDSERRKKKKIRLTRGTGTHKLKTGKFVGYGGGG